MHLAELQNVDITTYDLESIWNDIGRSNIVWDSWRKFIDQDDLHPQLIKLVRTIVDSIKIEPKNLLIQIFDLKLHNQKDYLKVVHRDADRMSCITIPLKYNMHETIMFYDDIPGLEYEKVKHEHGIWPGKPVQVSRYSSTHPTLVNVNKLHNVRVMDFTSPRVLFQLSFEQSFHDLIDENPSIWRVF